MWVEHLRAEFLNGVVSLERQGAGVSPSSLGFLRGLPTESSRRAILPVLVDKPLTDIKVACNREKRRMWT